MLTNYTASDIKRCIVNLNLLHHALRGDLDLTIADAESIIKEAQEALQTYQNFLLFRDTITDAMIKASEASGNPIFHERVYKRNFMTGEEESENENYN